MSIFLEFITSRILAEMVAYLSSYTMDAAMKFQLNLADPQHKKTTSSVLKSIITPRTHHRGKSAVLQQFELNREGFNLSPGLTEGSILPPGNPYVRQHRDENRNRENALPSPVVPVDVYEDKAQGFSFHKKSKSTVSLKSLMGTEKADAPKMKPRPKKQEEEKPKKSKSSTSLSALLSRPKSSKDLKTDMSRQQKDKENVTPPSSADIAPPPIWAQFAKQKDSVMARKVPLNDTRDVDNEMALYTPQEYSPSKQRNFHGFQKPSLSRKGERPKSAFLASGISTTSFAETLSGLRKYSHDRGESRSSNLSEQHRNSAESHRKSSSEYPNPGRGDRNSNRKVSDGSSNSGLTMAKRGSRVMAVVAALNGKSKEAAKETTDPKLDLKDIDNAFESLLVRVP